MAKTLDLLFQIDVAMSNGFQQPARVLNSEFSKLGASVQALDQKLGSLKEFSRLGEKLKANASAGAQAQTRLQTLGSELNRARLLSDSLSTRIEVQKQKITRLTQAHGKNSVQVQTSRQRLEHLTTGYRESLKQISALEREQEKLTQTTEKLSRENERDRNAYDELGRSLNVAEKGTRGLVQEQLRLEQTLTRVQKAQAKLAGIREKLTWGNIKADIMKTAGAYKMFEKPVALSMDFEAAMARVKSVAFSNDDADMSKFAALNDLAMKMGAQTKYTASEAAGAEENLLRANMSPDDVIRALPAVLNMASAEGMGIEQAGAIIAKGLGGMNLGAELAPRLADILAYTSANSNTNIAMLGEAFKVVAPVAASQNMQMEQVAAYLGILANKGFEGSEAGNALSSSLQRLAKMPAQTAKALNTLGVPIKTKDGKMRELPDILKALSESMGKMGEADQLGYLANIFGANYGKQMMALMQATVSGDVEKLQAGVYNSSFGRAQKMSDINLDTLNGQIEILKSSWEGLLMRIGNAVAPDFRKLVELLSSGLSAVNDFIDRHKVLADVIADAAAAYAAFRTLGTAAKYIKLLIELPAALAQLKGAQAAGDALAGAAGGAKLFGFSLKAAFGWAALLAFAAYEVYEHWDELKEWFNSWVIPYVWKPLEEGAQKCIEAVKSMFGGLWDWIKEAAAKLNPFNWELPSWLGGGNAGAQQVRNAEAALSGNLPGFASGGFIGRHSIIQVAEDGPEAVIPLTDKRRGVSLLMQAAEILGVKMPVQGNSPVIQNFGGSIQRFAGGSGSGIQEIAYPVQNYASESTAQNTNGSPVSITVNVDGSGESERGLAELIAQRVREVLGELLSVEERVSFA